MLSSVQPPLIHGSIMFIDHQKTISIQTFVRLLMFGKSSIVDHVMTNESDIFDLLMK